MKFLIVSEYDGHDEFVIEAKTYKEAFTKLLEETGYFAEEGSVLKCTS
jgi:hypothetical protein